MALTISILNVTHTFNKNVYSAVIAGVLYRYVRFSWFIVLFRYSISFLICLVLSRMKVGYSNVLNYLLLNYFALKFWQFFFMYFGVLLLGVYYVYSCYIFLANGF